MSRVTSVVSSGRFGIVQSTREAFDLLAREDHATVVNPALARALRFVQQPPA